MPSYLLKTEPSTYSFDTLLRDGRCRWDGVASPQAQGVLRSLRAGDRCYIYHTGTQRAVVGVALVERAAYPDPSAPALNAQGQPAHPVVDLHAPKALPTPVPLDAFRLDPACKDFALVRQPRLSVMEVPDGAEALIRRLIGQLDRVGAPTQASPRARGRGKA